MSKKKRDIEKAKKAKARQVKKQAKEKRQKNDYYRWEEKKVRKQQLQQAKWDAFPDAHSECGLPLSKTPSPVNCSRCELDCPHNRLY
jgi:hypothetical protein